MKKYILSLVALIATMSIQAQVIKVYKNGVLDYKVTSTSVDKYKVVFEEVPRIPSTREYVDLGLETGTLWATCNVGATSPEEPGDLFAWGETEPQADNAYSWTSYKYSNGSTNELIKYCTLKAYGYSKFKDDKSVLDAEDDAATVKRGSYWCTPTDKQFTELRENCTWEWTTNYNNTGKKGYIVKSNATGNTNSIFLPVTGCGENGEVKSDTWGCYWSSSLYSSDYPIAARTVEFYSGEVSRGWSYRCYGMAVRPVYVPESAPDPNLLTGKFSVGADKRVQFTKGNLQATYSASTSNYTWGFAANQYDYLGSISTNQGNSSIDSQQDGKVVDLFGWSTDATNNNWGIHTQTGTSDPYTGGNFKDWGELFPGKGYSTLSSDEWTYLLNTDKATSGARTQTNRFAKALVNGTKGLLIFPDDYNGTTDVSGAGIATVNSTGASFPTSSIPAETWATMESAGVVFLPAAGSRYGSTFNNVTTYGYYWSSTADGSNNAYLAYFYPYSVYPASNYSRNIGRSVRLVSVASE